MAEEQSLPNPPEASTAIIPAGPVSTWLTENGFAHDSLAVDHLGIELLRVEPELLLPLATALYAYGFNYLQCQGDDSRHPEEVRLKVFLPRDNPQLPSVYWIWRGADWQERECYDMFGIVYEGHPGLKRILMPEDWIGWPLRKDYISPDFYELQDAY